MKNIHILPTDKPSRLQKNKYNNLFLSEEPKSYSDCTNQNIYITNDEEIKEGDWFYNTVSLKPEPFKACENGDGYVNCSKYSHYRIDCKKIILTTDTDLIKEGVQAIDDEFLEWFVKNPSCEFVDVEKEWEGNGYMFGFKMGNASPDGSYIYKIIIPKEEDCSCTDECLGYLTKSCKRIEEPKQETLEEVAREYLFEVYQKQFIVKTNDIQHGVLKGFIAGAKWQQQQDKNLYSEEDMKQFGLYLGDNLKKLKGKTIDEIFEQFKKK